MSRIFYGIAGEGRGHAGRARALIEALRDRHEVTAYASGFALEMLAPLYAGTDVEVRALPRIAFHYDFAQRLDYPRTFFGNLPYLLRMNEHVDQIVRVMEREGPDLVITDFEPALPRAASKLGLPTMSVDHQHFLVTSDFAELPRDLRAYAAFMGPFVKAFCPYRDELVVSSFFEAPLAPTDCLVTQVGVLMQPNVRNAIPERGDHFVAYLRRDTSAAAIDALSHAPVRVHVYGLGVRPTRGRAEFFETHPTRFIEDLATARALVTTAGNQLVGEALWLGKPVLAVPEPGNFEQRINAYFLARSGAGRTCELEELDGSVLRRFLADEDALLPAVRRARRDGVAAAVARVERRLALAGAPTRAASRPSLEGARALGIAV